MQFLALLRRKTESFTEDQFSEVLPAEAERVRALYTEGVIRAAWSREDVLGGCLMLEAQSLPEAQSAIETLPLVARSMAEVQIVPLRGYRGFAPLGPTSGP